MPLTFDQVGIILNDVWRMASGSRYQKMLMARHIVGDRVFEDLGINTCKPQLRALLRDADRMMPELNFYRHQPGPIRFKDIAMKVLGFINTTCDLCEYVTSHWATLPANPLMQVHSLESIVQAMSFIQEDAAQLMANLDDDDVAIDPEFFLAMRKMGTLFYRLTLGDDRAHQLMTALNQANAHLKTHALIIQEEERLDPDDKKES